MRALRVAGIVLLVLLVGCSGRVLDDGRQGFEEGRWANESVPVTAEDGLNESEREAVVARSMARVEAVRGVEFRRWVEVEVITRAEYRNRSSGGGGGGGDGDRTYRDVRYEALFFVGERTDGTETRERNNDRAVQGYYDPGKDKVVIVSETKTPRIDEGTLAQELFHAYQFRHLIPRSGSGTGPRTFDETRAILSVIEGDANLVEYRYKQRCESEWNCVSEGDSGGSSDGDDSGNDDGDDSSSGGPGINMGVYLLQYFPYAEGEQYVRTVQAAEGWDGVDDLYGEMPNSTAAVIHRGDHRTVAVEVEDDSGSGWSRVERGEENYQVVGEAGLASMFAYTLYDGTNETLVARSAFLNLENGSLDDRNPLNYGLEASSGWVGDRMLVYRNDADETAYVWRIRFRDAGEAREFLSAYRRLLEYRNASRVGDGRWRIDSGPFADAFAVSRDGDAVTIVNAPEVGDLDDLYSGNG